jgi:cyclic pyranopterin phosphate synthase
MAGMYDKKNRRIDYLRISVTDRCNMRCVYCMPTDGVRSLGHDEVLSYEEILRVARVAAALGISKIRLTGGEPLIRRGLTGLIRELSELKGITDLSLTTNGTLLEAKAGELRDAGITRINVSLDSLKPDRFTELTRGGDLGKVIAGIEKAASLGFTPIKINMVPVRGINDDEIEGFARLTIDKPYHIRFIEFMPIGDRKLWDETIVIPSSEVMDRISRIGEIEPVGKEGEKGPATLFRLPGAKGILGFISPISDHFCGSCNRLRLTADGKLRPCLFAESEIDLKTPMRTGCDDEEIARLMVVALDVKPEGHQLAEGVKKRYSRTMSRIGG